MKVLVMFLHFSRGNANEFTTNVFSTLSKIKSYTILHKNQESKLEDRIGILPFYIEKKIFHLKLLR